VSKCNCTQGAAIILYDYSDLDGFFLLENRVCRLSFRLPHANNARQQTADRTDGQPFAQSARTEEFRGLRRGPSFVFPSPAFQPAPPSREKALRSITAARLSTHIFDCSANMPKFIPRPSSATATWTMPATIELSSFRLGGGDEFARSRRCARKVTRSY